MKQIISRIGTVILIVILFAILFAVVFLPALALVDISKHH